MKRTSRTLFLILAFLGFVALGTYGCGKSDGNGAGGKVIITGSGGT